MPNPSLWVLATKRLISLLKGSPSISSSGILTKREKLMEFECPDLSRMGRGRDIHKNTSNQLALINVKYGRFWKASFTKEIGRDYTQLHFHDHSWQKPTLYPAEMNINREKLPWKGWKLNYCMESMHLVLKQNFTTVPDLSIHQYNLKRYLRSCLKNLKCWHFYNWYKKKIKTKTKPQTSRWLPGMAICMVMRNEGNLPKGIQDSRINAPGLIDIIYIYT